ncbi:MAG: SPOR domain-containing protein, partial [Desulfobacterales bacterium]
REPAAPPAPPAQAAVFPAVSAPPERRPFSLLLESLRARENALAAQRSWRKRGLSPYLVQAELGEKGTWWRLLLGAYRSLPEALAARRELGIDAAVPVKTPFGNLVGEFSDPQEAAVLRERLAARGWDPYLLEESGRPLRVFVGAFADTASAEKQRRELGAQGIEARTVPR